MPTSTFRKKIRTSLVNPALQSALDNNAERRRQGRAAAFASLPDWRERRHRAHQIRAEVIGHLDAYLEKFSRQASANGFKVHRAADSVEALKIVLDIIDHAPTSSGPNGARLVAKSKSMVTEEVELNHGLEAAGHRVVETDLGEYIVQLRGEKPSHIITPAVHLPRQEVGRLFHERLDAPYTEDIPELTGIARKTLREVFLKADVGISGVNFGIAETGTICIVTNEGNGRMVTTLPTVHIALMGCERLVPGLDDLALMLSLLPRSATGQKLTVYTNLINGPVRDGNQEGPRERHIILLDNGRIAMSRSPLAEALYCIRCGACLNACPVFRELGGHAYLGTNGSIAPYPGPIGSIVSPGFFGAEQFGQLAQASTLCGACEEACPVEIDLPKLLLRVRAGMTPEPPTPRYIAERSGVGLPSSVLQGLRLYRWAATRPALFGLGQRVVGIASRILSPRSSWMRLPALTGWGTSRDLPRPADKPFRALWQQTQAGIVAGKISREPSREENDTITRPEEIHDNYDLVSQFRQEVSMLGGLVWIVEESQLTDQLVTFLKDRQIEQVQMWAQIEGVDRDQLEQAGIRTVEKADGTIRCGITGALAALADTGTLVLPGGAGRPLTASLLPEIHVAVVRAESLVKSLPDALRLPEIREPSATILVTGPSRTADIEMTLTIGVHGPRELYIFVIGEKE